MIDLSGKTAMVTGGTRGIGNSISTSLAVAGAKVIVTYLKDEAAASDFAYTNRRLPNILPPIRMDIRDRDSIKGASRNILKDFDKLDILVNNAGINEPMPFDRLHDEAWNNVIETNLTGTKNVIMELWSSISVGGSIVSISSVSAYLGGPTSVHYAASKAGIEALTKGLSKQLALRKIRVNCVAPGYIRSTMTEISSMDDKVKWTIEHIPMGRLGLPNEVAGAVLWLCSDLASYVTGQVIHVNGGLI